MSFADVDDEPVAARQRARGRQRVQVEQTEEEILEKTKFHKEETKKSLDRANRTLEQTLAVQSETSKELRRQGEQIDTMKAQVDHVDDSITIANTLVKSIDSVFYALNPFKKRPKSKTPATTSCRDEGASQAGIRPLPTGAGASRGSSQRTEELRSAGYDDEEFASLQKMSNNLGALKSASQNMGDEITNQNQKLEELNVGVERVNRRLAATTAKVKRMT
ncbi:hypothetical protein DIPPA_56293 [Diplonema papillatum]|nr:hypothetical protein DIPPA_56293 [Diplonema papillatum]